MRKLIIDADTGSDDAVALVMAIRNLPKESILGCWKCAAKTRNIKCIICERTL